jgi:GTP-binding protein HflX
VLLPCGSEILLTDTVGFIRKLPHHLIEAFRSTLEEVVYADLIIHVADASNPRMDTQMAVVYDTLNDLGAGVKPVYTLFNKIDLLKEREGHHLWDSRAEKTYCISAKTGEGIEAFAEGLAEFILLGQILYEETIPYTKASLISRIRSEGQLMTEEYREDGIYVKALVPSPLYGKLLSEI